jgi:hypothetical protein
VRWVQVLDEHESCSGMGGQALEELSECFQTAGGRSDPGDDEGRRRSLALGRRRLRFAT